MALSRRDCHSPERAGKLSGEGPTGSIMLQLVTSDSRHIDFVQMRMRDKLINRTPDRISADPAWWYTKLDGCAVFFF